MNEKQKILKAYEDTINEAVFSDKHGMVLSLSSDAIGLINKVKNMLSKKEPHWPDVVQNIKKAVSALQRAQKAAK
jgi:hypothetical protein